MSFILDLMTDLRADEGERLFVYDDATGKAIIPGSQVIGNATIGVGRNVAGLGITIEESALLLNNDCTRVISWCSRNLPWFTSLTDIRQRAVCNLVFWVGPHGFLTFVHLNMALSTGNWQEAREALLDSNAAKECPQRAGHIARMLFDNTETV